MLRPTQKRSIGEVLALLKTEFNDITISKIRFLEAQGLVDPERTPSGYRKFSDDDVARLRYILRQQREHFLPLKVIKGRLLQDSNDVSAEMSDSGVSDNVGGDGGPVDRSTFLESTGLSESQARELESFNLLRSDKSAQGTWYSADTVTLGRLAARFLAFGVEARHLRIFKTAADREADLYKQMAGSSRTGRRGQAQVEAAARLEELSRLGESLHGELLRQAMEER